MAMPKIKTGHYAPVGGHGVEPTRADAVFEQAMNNSAHAEQKLMFAAAECVFETSRRFVKASSWFDDDELARARVKIREAVQTGSVPPIAVALRVFLTTIDRALDLGSNTPEAQLVNAAQCLEDAVHDWGQADYVTAHANTVRCRSYLNHIIE